LDRPEIETKDGLLAMPLLEMEDLCVSFLTERGAVPVVNAVSLSLEAGQTLAVVGESGSGKSVTALSILRLIGATGKIESGRIIFEGQDLVNLSDPEMRAIRGNEIAMIFQEPLTALNPTMPVGKQIAEGLRIHRELSLVEALKEAANLLQKVAIPDAARRIHDYPHQFSGGMRQRVMIAMALACGPKLVIADEPTTALDVTVQAQVLDLLQTIVSQFNSSLILITHDLGLVARYADHVAVMYAGRIVENAPVKELFGRPMHPYTQGLINSVPAVGLAARSNLFSIGGHPPDLAAVPAGCAFAPRCIRVAPKCHIARPQLRSINNNHFFACDVDE
jgi:oligopeptide transport system ATP-binding protein